MNNFCSLESQYIGRYNNFKLIKKNKLKKNISNNIEEFFSIIKKSKSEPINPINFLVPTLFLTQLVVLTNSINV